MIYNSLSILTNKNRKITQINHHINIVECPARLEALLKDWKIKYRLSQFKDFLAVRREPLSRIPLMGDLSQKCIY